MHQHLGLLDFCALTILPQPHATILALKPALFSNMRRWPLEAAEVFPLPPLGKILACGICLVKSRIRWQISGYRRTDHERRPLCVQSGEQRRYLVQALRAPTYRGLSVDVLVKTGNLCQLKVQTVQLDFTDMMYLIQPRLAMDLRI